MQKCHFSNISNQISEREVLLLAVKGTNSLKMHVTAIGSVTGIKAVLHSLSISLFSTLRALITLA